MASKPVTSTIVRDQAIGFSLRWSVETLRGTLIELLSGDFARPAMLAEAMLGDDQILTSYQQICLEVTGRDLFMLPSSEGDGRSKKAWARECQSFFGDAMPEAATWELIKWTELLGVAVGQLIVDPKGRGPSRRWYPRVHVHPPHFLRYVEHEDRWTYTTRDGTRTVTPGQDGWFLWMPRGRRGYVEGAIRALAHPWMARTFAKKDWSRWSELYGNGMIKARHPKGANDPEVRRWLSGVRNLGREPVVAIPKDYDVEMINTTNAQADGFEKLLRHCDTAITRVLQGQTLTSGTAENGTRALGEVHRQTGNLRTVGRVKALATFEREQVLMPASEWNIGNANVAPWPARDIDPTDNGKEGADALKSFGEAIASLSEAGIPIDLVTLAERFNVPINDAIDVADRVFFSLKGEHLKAMRVDEVRERLGLEPMGDKRGDQLFGATAAPAAPGSSPPPEDGTPPPNDDETPPSDGEEEPDEPDDDPEKAAADDADPPKTDLQIGVAKVSKLARHKGARNGQDFADRLVDDGADAFGEEIERDVDRILTIVDKATGFDDLRKKTIRAHARMSPKRAGARLAKTATIAEVAGRASVLEDLDEKS